MSDYPKTVAEILDAGRTYRPAVLRAMKAFRRGKPWRGTLREQLWKLQEAANALAKAYGIAPPVVFPSWNYPAHYDRLTNFIVLQPNLSVVTFLHEFAHAAFGRSERQAVGWSVNLFRRIFPRSYARLRHEGHMLFKP